MPDKFNPESNPDTPAIYQIRIKGQLGSGWTGWFEGLTPTLEENDHTLLTGPVADQAALHGLLKKVRDLGMPLISVIRVEPGLAAASSELKATRLIKMNNSQKMGGIAALINAAAYIVGFGMVFTLLAPVLNPDPDKSLAFLADKQALIVVWHIIIYLVAGVFMVPLALALHERLKAKAPAMMPTATAFGLIWAGLIIASGMLYVNDADVVTKLYGKDPAQAKTVWLALSAVENGLGGAIELPGGLWALLVSWAALRVGGLPRALNYLGVLIGVSGIVTVIPILAEPGASIFGLGFIAWFAWVGIIMLRSSPSAAA